MQGIIFFIVIFILAFFKIDIEASLKTILVKFPIVAPEYVTKYIDVLKPLLISGVVVIIQKIIYSLNFLKTGFFIKITQKNKRNEINETVINQHHLLEVNRTVQLDIKLDSKKSLKNYLLKKMIHHKDIYLYIFLEEVDKRYISLSSDEGIVENSNIKFNVTSYLNQVINLEIPGEEKFEYIIDLELEPSEAKKKKIIIDLKFVIGENSYEDIKIFWIFKLEKLLKLEYTKHIIDLNKEGE